MAEAKTDEPEKDEHGLVIHTYRSKVLVVVPSKDFDETALRYARSALFNVHVGTTSVSTDDSDLIQGHLQDEFQVDARLDGATDLADYSGVLFCGGPGSADLAENPDALRLAREAAESEKLLAAWGDAVGVLAAAGVVAKKRVTGTEAVRAAVKAAKGRFTGNQVERHGSLVTGRDDASGLRFGKLLARVVGI